MQWLTCPGVASWGLPKIKPDFWSSMIPGGSFGVAMKRQPWRSEAPRSGHNSISCPTQLSVLLAMYRKKMLAGCERDSISHPHRSDSFRRTWIRESPGQLQHEIADPLPAQCCQQGSHAACAA
ncbi:unnamed protein product [Symbiodinium natans]|uniref:Uncharacterized protein n=1 Tax=Symbiodinium natans TaxID=878477 RepID=A0A812UU25_9DINO|nr:unnamed protein product [Symbiodinium natans]